MDVYMNEAENLVDTGEWIFESLATSRIREHCRRFIELIDAPSSRTRAIVMDEILPVVQKILLDDHNFHSIKPSPTRRRIHAVRLREGHVLRVTATAQEVIFKGLALGLAIATTPLNTAITLAFGGITIYEIIKTYQASWEKLEDSEERQMFEAIATLSARLSIRDFDALNEANYSAAYGRSAPTIEEITQELGDLDRRSIEKSLHELKRRNIIANENGRWRIVF